MENITYKDILNWNGYQISNNGIVKSKDRYVLLKQNKNFTVFKKGRILNVEKSKKGYLRIKLSLDGLSQFKSIHRLVAEAFIPNPLNLPEVNHKDGNKSNNNDWNLEWSTSSNNQKHAFDLGLRVSIIGEKNNMAKLKENDILKIRLLYVDKSISQRKLSELFNVSQTTIKDITKNKTWKHLV